MERKRGMITIADILNPEHILIGFEADTRNRALAKVADLLERDDRLMKLGAIDGIKRLGRPALLARLKKLHSTETDPEVAEALKELEATP